MKTLKLGSIAIILLGILFGCGSSNDNNETEKQEVKNETIVERKNLTSSPEKIRTDFLENELSANQKYLNNIILMEDCEVEEIKQGDGTLFPSTDVYVRIKLEQLNGYLGNVYCFLLKDEISKAANLKKGDKIKVKGKLTKLWRGGGDTFEMHLRECKAKLYE